jgi:hypothetical protein
MVQCLKSINEKALRTIVNIVFALTNFDGLLTLYECWAFRTSKALTTVLKIGEALYSLLFNLFVREHSRREVSALKYNRVFTDERQLKKKNDEIPDWENAKVIARNRR